MRRVMVFERSLVAVSSSLDSEVEAGENGSSCFAAIGFYLDMLILPVVEDILMGKITEVLLPWFWVIRDFTQEPLVFELGRNAKNMRIPSLIWPDRQPNL